jgi:tetratricopeptide (TPR) repeat protein
MSRPRLIALLLVLGTLAAYLPVARNDFVNFDDNDYVTDNLTVQNGLSVAGIEWAFTTVHSSNWHPLTWMSHMLDCTLFGLNPAAHHFVNVLFHAANTALLFALWWRLTGRLWPSAMVAALFSWHPLHVESVAWVAERKDVLCAFFWMLALLAYGKYATGGWQWLPGNASQPSSPSQRGERKGSGPMGSLSKSASRFNRQGSRLYWLSLLCYVLALLAKPMAVTLPFALLLLDYWPLGRMFSGDNGKPALKALILEKAPFFLLSVVSCVVTLVAQSLGGSVATLDDAPAGLRIENALAALATYLWKFFWPAPLAVLYPLHPVSAVEVAASVVVLAGVSLAVWHLRRLNRCWLMGWLWFLVTLAPVIGIIQVGNAAMADRYTYLPSIGIFSALAFGLSEAGTRFSWLKSALPAFAALALLAGLALMERQLQFWRDSETLFRHAIAVTDDNFKAHANLGVALERKGNYEEAIAESRKAFALGPGAVHLHYFIGCLLDKLGRPAESLAEFREAVRLSPDKAPWHCAEGIELVELGRGDEALEEFAVAARLDPEYAQPHIETAEYFFRQGRDAEGVRALHEALKCKPQTFQTLATVAHYLAANENASARDGRYALELARQANDLSGAAQPVVLDVLGMACAETGDFTNAVASAQSALELATAAKLNTIDALQKRLDLYRNGQPWHESFQTTNAPAK